MPARSNRSRPRSGGRVTPKGTRSDVGHDRSRPDARRSAPPAGQGRFDTAPDRGVRPTGFRPPAPRAGTRGNR